MTRKLNIKVLGVIENMSYIKCPDCDKKIKLFNGEDTEKFLKNLDLNLLGELPMISSISNLSKGEEHQDEFKNIFNKIVENIINNL